MERSNRTFECVVAAILWAWLIGMVVVELSA